MFTEEHLFDFNKEKILEHVQEIKNYELKIDYLKFVKKEILIALNVITSGTFDLLLNRIVKNTSKMTKLRIKSHGNFIGLNYFNKYNYIISSLGRLRLRLQILSHFPHKYLKNKLIQTLKSPNTDTEDLLTLKEYLLGQSNTLQFTLDANIDYLVENISSSIGKKDKTEGSVIRKKTSDEQKIEKLISSALELGEIPKGEKYINKAMYRKLNDENFLKKLVIQIENKLNSKYNFSEERTKNFVYVIL